MKKILRVCLLLLMVMNATSLFAQTRVVTGVVINGDGNQPLAGVTVLARGSREAVITDNAGKYLIKIPQAVTELEFRYVGYAGQVVRLGNATEITVTLSPAAGELGGVTVVGYGTQKSKNVTGAIAKVTADQLDEKPVNRIDHAMVGKLAGVQVQETSGLPGQAYKIKVRGVNSINNASDPLYVVDGFPISGDLNSINPGDIQSIEVLKDAASAAIYGSRGSSGVVLITTKTGTSKPTLEFDTYYGIQKRFSKIDVLNRDEFIDFAIEERNNSWVLNGGNASDPNSVRTNTKFWIDPLWLTDPKSLPDNDWQKLSEQKAPVTDYHLAASGATGNSKYYISGDYFKQTGIIIGSDFGRLSFRSNVETKLSSRVNIGLNLSASSTTQNGSADNIAQDGMNMEQLISQRAMAPTLGLNQQTQNGGYSVYYAAFIINPLAIAKEFVNYTKGKELLGNLYANVDILDHLKFRTSFGYNYATGSNQQYFPTDIRRGNPTLSTASIPSRENYLSENIFTYDLQKSKWSLNALAGFTYQQEDGLTYSLQNTNYPDDVIQTMNAGLTPTIASSSATQWSLMSFLGRVNFNYLEKYLLTANIRRDGSSRFGSKNRWGLFPSVSVGWMLNEENFMKDIDFVSLLKLRASYGEVGNNNISNYASKGLLGQDNYILGSGEVNQPGYAPASISNPDLGWEKTSTINLGVDAGFFRNRIIFGMDIYRADTKDLLLNVQIPSITGFSNSLQNIGKVRNSGVEFELTTRNLVGEFKWTTSANISFNKNKVLALGKNGDPIFGNVFGSDVTITEIGAPIGSYYTFVQEGVFMNQQDFDSHPHYKNQNVGDIKYKDINNDGVIDNKDMTITGNNNPKYYWGFSNTFAYKGLDLTVTGDGQAGNKMMNLGRVEGGQSRGNVDGYWRNRWRSPAQPGNGWVPRAAVTDNLSTLSTYMLNNAAFWRIRTLSLGYFLPAKLFKGLRGISSLRIYGSIDNVYMHDDYFHDQQQGSVSNSNLAPGVEYIGTYPLARTYTLGLNLKF